MLPSRLLKKPICDVVAPSATFRLNFKMPESPEGGILTYGLGTLRFPQNRRPSICDPPSEIKMLEIPGGESFLSSLPQGRVFQHFPR